MKSPKKKVKRRSRKKKNTTLIALIIFAVTLFIVSIITLYTLVIFPGVINKKIKNNLSSIYKPYAVKDGDGVYVMKLKSKPDYSLQKKVYDIIYENYGLEVFFEKIKSTDERGINKLTFFRGTRRFEDPGEVYIYWNIDKKPDIQPVQVPAVTQAKSNGENRNSYSINKKNAETNKNKSSHSVVKERKIETKNEVRPQESGKKPAVISEKKRSTPVLTAPVVTKEDTEHASQYQKTVITDGKVPERPAIDPQKHAKLIIIIDDVGYKYRAAEDFINSNLNLTYALIPGLPETKMYYNRLNSFGRNMILHIPMEPEKGRQYVETNAVLTSMSAEEIRTLVGGFFTEYPDCLGANNHMGSKAVKNAGVMRTVLSVIRSHNRVWIDSLTTPGSLAGEMCSLDSVPYLKRDVFLDNENTENYVRKALDNLITIARQRGYAVGIGHIQSDALIRVLKEYNSERESRNISFIGIQDVL